MSHAPLKPPPSLYNTAQRTEEDYLRFLCVAGVSREKGEREREQEERTEEEEASLPSERRFSQLPNPGQKQKYLVVLCAKGLTAQAEASTLSKTASIPSV